MRSRSEPIRDFDSIVAVRIDTIVPLLAIFVPLSHGVRRTG